MQPFFLLQPPGKSSATWATNVYKYVLSSSFGLYFKCKWVKETYPQLIINLHLNHTHTAFIYLLKFPLNCVSIITVLFSVSDVLEYTFVFDSTLCTIWVMSCLDESGITLYLWSAILYQSQDYIGWKCTYQTARETIVVEDSYVQGNNSCAVVWPKAYRGNISLTDMEMESKWLQSEDRDLTTQSLSSSVTTNLQVKSISDLLFWDRFVNADRWVRLSVEKSFERQMLKWDETRKNIRLSP